MNNIFISHTSAFEFLRYNRNDLTPTKLELTTACPDYSTKYPINSTATNLSPYNQILHSPINLLMKNKNFTYKNSAYKFHINKNTIPKNSFLKASPQIYIASPELVFCELSEIFSFEKLMLLGLELCGTYSICEELESGFITDCAPLTTPAKLKNFTKSLRKRQTNQKGIQKASIAAEILESQCASPQEARLFTILASPRKFGGYGIKNIKLNSVIKLSADSSKLCGQKIIIPDLCIHSSKIAIEYDSDAFHENSMQNRRDKLRIDALTNDGWTVIIFVPTHLHDYESFKKMVKYILKANNQDTRIRTTNFDIKNKRMYDSLYEY